MTHEPGTTVRTLLDLMALDDSIVPIGTTGQVIGHQGDKVLVVFQDGDTGEPVTFAAESWELLRLKTHVRA